MLIHTVYFWLKKDLSEEQIKKFEKEINTLTAIESLEKGYCGKPANTPERPVIDRSYSWGLTTIFESVEQEELYQKDPIHLEFVGGCKELWDKIVVYDVEV
jgi:hypothetical protein